MHTKTCPRCGQELFADMNVCYECLFEFEEETTQVPLEAYAFDTQEQPAHMQVVLELKTSSVDLKVPVPQTGLIVGRGSACDIVLHTPAVSRKHLRLQPADGSLLVADLGAQNAATLNGTEVRNTTRMVAGDVLEVCGTTFVLAP